MALGRNVSRTITGDGAWISIVPSTTLASTVTCFLLEILHKSKHTIAESVGEDNAQSKESLSYTLVVYVELGVSVACLMSKQHWKSHSTTE